MNELKVRLQGYTVRSSLGFTELLRRRAFLRVPGCGVTTGLCGL